MAWRMVGYNEPVNGPWAIRHPYLGVDLMQPGRISPVHKSDPSTILIIIQRFNLENNLKLNWSMGLPQAGVFRMLPISKEIYLYFMADYLLAK